MSAAFFELAALLYVGTAAAYLVPYLRRGPDRASRVGEGLLLAGFALHALAIGVGCAQFGGRELFSLAGGLALASWLGAGACLLTQRLAQMPQLGAFVAPLLAAALAPAALAGLAGADLPAAALRERALQAHVVAAALALALFAIAAGIAAMYLLQRSQLKRKRFGRLFSRLPPLEALARLHRRVLLAGLASSAASFLSGSVAASALWEDAWWWDPRQLASALLLAVYAAVALPGTWPPRRRALASVLAFAVTLGTMLALRAVPGATRHGGDYGVSVASAAAPRDPGR